MSRTPAPRIGRVSAPFAFRFGDCGLAVDFRWCSPRRARVLVFFFVRGAGNLAVTPWGRCSQMDATPPFPGCVAGTGCRLCGRARCRSCLCPEAGANAVVVVHGAFPLLDVDRDGMINGDQVKNCADYFSPSFALTCRRIPAKPVAVERKFLHNANYRNMHRPAIRRRGRKAVFLELGSEAEC